MMETKEIIERILRKIEMEINSPNTPISAKDILKNLRGYVTGHLIMVKSSKPSLNCSSMKDCYNYGCIHSPEVTIPFKCERKSCSIRKCSLS